jgi:predicted RecB family endonuclease
MTKILMRPDRERMRELSETIGVAIYHILDNEVELSTADVVKLEHVCTKAFEQAYTKIFEVDRDRLRERRSGGQC